MSVNFYNSSGIMVMVDTHAYKPTPPAWPHLVGAPLSWLSMLYSKRLASVTAQSAMMIQSGLDLYLVPHVFVGMPPSAVPPAPLQLAAIFAASGSVAYLTVHKVSGCGDQLTCCVSGMIGWNVNCNDPLDLPNGTVFQWNTVQTQPTLGDYIGAVVAYFMDAMLAFFVNNIIEGSEIEGWVALIVQHIVRLVPSIPRVSDLPLFPRILLDPGGTGGPIIQKLIDGD